MSSKRDVTVKALSSNLLQMKFMKKTVLASQEDDDNDLYKEDAEHWVIDPQLSRKRKSEFHIQPSHAMCEDLAYGRMSFKGFNPTVEKIMRVMRGDEPEEEEAVTAEDKEFAEEYASVSNIAKKFSTKKQNREKDLKYCKRNKSERFGSSHHRKQKKGQR